MQALRTLAVTLACLTASALAQAEDFARLIKGGPPALEIHIYTSISEQDKQGADQIARVNRTAQNVVDAFLQAGATSIPLDWDKVPVAMKERLGKEGSLDHRVQCNVGVRAVGKSSGYVYIDMACRPQNTYRNGVVIEASYNNMTAQDVSAKAKDVPAQIADMYAKFKKLEEQGLTAVTLR